MNKNELFFELVIEFVDELISMKEGYIIKYPSLSIMTNVESYSIEPYVLNKKYLCIKVLGVREALCQVGGKMNIEKSEWFIGWVNMFKFSDKNNYPVKNPLFEKYKVKLDLLINK